MHIKEIIENFSNKFFLCFPLYFIEKYFDKKKDRKNCHGKFLPFSLIPKKAFFPAYTIFSASGIIFRLVMTVKSLLFSTNLWPSCKKKRVGFPLNDLYLDYFLTIVNNTQRHFNFRAKNIE